MSDFFPETNDGSLNRVLNDLYGVVAPGDWPNPFTPPPTPAQTETPPPAPVPSPPPQTGLPENKEPPPAAAAKCPLLYIAIAGAALVFGIYLWRKTS